MKVTIQPTQIIAATIDADNLDVTINQDTGENCIFRYSLINAEQSTIATGPLKTGVYTITGSEYTAYNSSDNRLLYAVDYICNQLNLTKV